MGFAHYLAKEVLVHRHHRLALSSGDNVRGDRADLLLLLEEGLLRLRLRLGVVDLDLGRDLDGCC